ncbi:hypothetical protein Gpo141_00008524 [Globisporangium polare]
MRGSKVVELDLMSKISTTRKNTRQSFMDHVKSSISRRTSFARAKSAAEQFHVRCSTRVFALFWLGILLLHSLCAAYYAAASYLYLYIMPISIGSNLRRYALKLTLKQYTWIAYAHGVLAAPHAICVLQMLVYSLFYRRLVFESAYSSRIKSPKFTSKLHSKMLYSKCCGTLSRKSFYWRKWLFGHTGLFGLGGPHFRTVTLIQEATEIVLQTTQAYRMSCWLPRVWLTRNYVALLVFNCWSTSVIQRFTQNNLPLERLLVFLAALLTDLAAIIAIPVALVYPYFAMWAPERSNFARSYWYDDVWLINMVNEAQIILVTSVWDILGRLVFSVSLLMTFMVVKTLIKPASTKVGTIMETTVVASAPSVQTINSTQVESFSTTPVETFSSNNKSPVKDLVSGILESKASTSIVPPSFRGGFMPRRSKIPGTSTFVTSTFAGPRFFVFQDKLVHWGHRVFLMWGLLILIVQIHADHLPEPQLCGLRVRPWFQSKPSCSLLEVDCYKLNLTGAVNEIKSAMDQMNQPVLAHVVFRHCPNLQMPPNLKLLSRLIGFKVFNSTLTRWEQDAALTNTNNPRLTFMFMVKVNMTELPQGLQTNDYPKHMTDVEFSTTNLTTLPADLHTKWPKGMVLVLERAKFNHVPDVLKRMQVGYLGFGENNVTDVPIEIFTHPYARSIWLNGNPITRLPDGPVLSSLAKVRMVNSNVSVETLPPWVASTLLTHATFVAGGTPLCAMIAKLKAAGTDMSALGEPLAKVYKNVVCTAFTGDLFTYYPLSYENKYNAGVALPGN